MGLRYLSLIHIYGVAAVVRKMRGREKWMIPILMILFGIGGTTFGMWEETMAFYPILLPVFLAAGYDAAVSISVVLLGAGTGVLCSTVNPFATGIASGFAGVSLGQGIVLRVVMLIAYEAVAILFVMRYAARIKADPEKSVMAHNRWSAQEMCIRDRCHCGRSEYGGHCDADKIYTVADRLAADFSGSRFSNCPGAV